MPGYYAPSEEELASQGGDFTTVPEDEYLVKIRAITVKNMENRYPSKGDDGPTHDMLQVNFDVLSFANGDDLVDEDDNPVTESVQANALLNPKKVGMVPQPSKTRKFFAAALGQKIGDPIAIDDWDDLVGKQLYASLKPNNGYNNATDFRGIRRGRTRATTPGGPVEGRELERRIEAVADEDAPSNVSSRKSSADTGDDLDF